MHASRAYCDVGLDRHDAATIVRVTGEVDLFAAPVLADALKQAGTSAPLVVDLSDCAFFDSAGLNALLRAHLDAERDGRALLVARTPRSCPDRLLELAVPGRFPAHRTREDALAALAL